MSNYLHGVLLEPLCELVDLQIQVTEAIIEVTTEIVQDNNSSDNEDMPRPMFDRTYTGHRYVLDVLAGHPGRAYQCFRLPPDAFINMRDLLVSRGHLRDTKNMLAAEQLGIFLRGVAHANSYRQLCEFFQHSLETVSRYFNMVLRALVSLADEFIVLPKGDVECHPYVRSNTMFHPYFKNAIGAIDGTHIPAVVPNAAQNRYRNRKGFTSQNVMAAVSFDMYFNMYFNISQTEMEHDTQRGEVDMSDEDPNLLTTIGERIQGEAIRQVIATDMWNSRVNSQRNRSA